MNAISHPVTVQAWGFLPEKMKKVLVKLVCGRRGKTRRMRRFVEVREVKIGDLFATIAFFCAAALTPCYVIINSYNVAHYCEAVLCFVLFYAFLLKG